MFTVKRDTGGVVQSKPEMRLSTLQRRQSGKALEELARRLGRSQQEGRHCPRFWAHISKLNVAFAPLLLLATVLNPVCRQG